MLITTFNVRTPCDKEPPIDWASRFPRIKQLLAKHALPLLGLQESRIEQLTDLCADGQYAFIGVGRQNPGERGDGEYSAILYDKSVFSVAENGTFWLSETPEVPGSKSWETSYARICTWGRFTELASGRVFYHFNTHLDHRSPLAQKNGLLLILDRMEQAVQSGIPCFLTGDFNIFPDNEAIAVAKQKLNYANDVSATPVVGPTYTYHGYKPLDSPHKGPIDYIFTTRDVKVKSVRVLDDLFDGQPPSDHFPVTAEVEF